MSHALLVLKRERELLRDAYRHALADRTMEDRNTILAELSREIRDLNAALAILRPPKPEPVAQPKLRPVPASAVERTQDRRALASLERDWKRGATG